MNGEEELPGTDDGSVLDLLTRPLIGEITTLDILWIAIILIAGITIAQFVKIWLKRTLGDKVPASDLDLMTTIVTYLIYLVVILSILPHLHFDLTGLWVAGGIGAVAIAFATQNIVANFVSGIFLLFERPIKIGDTVIIGSTWATVQKIQIMSTIVRAFDGTYIRMPNANLFTSDISNLVIHPARRFEYTIRIRYQDDAGKAIRIIKEMIEKEPYALKSPGPAVYVDKLDDSSVNIVVRIWSPSLYWWDLRTELLWKLKVELEKNDIFVPFPQRELWFNNLLKTDTKTIKGPPPMKEVPIQEAEKPDAGIGKSKPGETYDW